MTTFRLTIDTQSTSGAGVRSIVRIARPISVRGVINTRWDEFSAVGVAAAAGLHNVVWDCVSDDTPGSLEVTLLRHPSRCAELRALIRAEGGVECRPVMQLMYVTDCRTTDTGSQ